MNIEFHDVDHPDVSKVLGISNKRLTEIGKVMLFEARRQHEKTDKLILGRLLQAVAIEAKTAQELIFGTTIATRFVTEMIGDPIGLHKKIMAMQKDDDKINTNELKK